MTIGCSISKPIFLTARKFEVVKEYKGAKGFFIKTFLIDSTTNLNDWEVTARANMLDGGTFIGRPGILFEKDGRRDHTSGTTLESSLAAQKPFRKADILEVGGTKDGIRLTQVSEITDRETQRLIENHDIEFISPAIFPKSLDDVEIIPVSDEKHIHRVHRYDGLHYAFVDDPAYGPKANIETFCKGESCLIKLQQQQAAAKAANSNSSYISQYNNSNQEMSQYVSVDEMEKEKKKTNDLEARMNKIATELEEEKRSKKAAEEDETKKKEAEGDHEKDKNSKAKKGADEDITEEKKKENAKKAQDEEEKKKDDEMTALKQTVARYEAAEKLEIIDKLIAVKMQTPGFDTEQAATYKAKLLKASVETLEDKWDDLKVFAAVVQPQINSESRTQSNIGYGLTASTTNTTQYSAQTSDEVLERLDS